jgi:hypothetical protein
MTETIDNPILNSPYEQRTATVPRQAVIKRQMTKPMPLSPHPLPGHAVAVTFSLSFLW